MRQFLKSVVDISTNDSGTVRGQDTVRFFRTWLASPGLTGSVCPSSPGLAALITSQITLDATPVLELGPGTGVFTAALVERGIAPVDLTLVEAQTGFADLLRARYPQATIHQIDAAHITPELRSDGGLHAAAISGLPLLAMPPEKVAAILAATFSTLRPDASLYQFTYGWRCPVRSELLSELGLNSQRVGFRLDNTPPATVYRLYRRA